MKNIKNLQLILGITFTILFTSVGSAQNLMQNNESKAIEVAAKNEVQKWEEELSLTAKQMMLMERKFVEYAIKREKLVKENIPEEEKVERLKDLKILEIRNMRDILTQPQYDRYILILQQEAEAEEAERRQ